MKSAIALPVKKGGAIFLCFSERRDGAVEDALQIGERHAVVADRYAGFRKGSQPLFQLFARDHAAAALNHERIVGRAVGERVQTRYEFELQPFAGPLSDQVGQFDAADVVAVGLMRAGFQQ